jgi:diacylglycerol O-acyltransferase / wax synthase
MTQKHMDRLSPVDVSFLDQEKQGSHMHIGAVMTFEGPPPTREDLRAHIESRLHLVPRYRQKLAFPRLEMGRPLWVDDPSFNVDYHVRHTALPQPGGKEQLRLLAGRIFSQRLDRTKPLWELWLVQGLEDNRFAVINKTHHSLVDGVSGIDLTTVLFDASPAPSKMESEAWSPRPEPSNTELVTRGLKGLVGAPIGLARRAVDVARRPKEVVAEVAEAAEGLGEVAWSFINQPPETPLNVPIGPHRRVRWLDFELADLKTIKNELGGTVNDVFLAIATGALRRWLQSRGVRTEGLELRGIVPVSIRADKERGALGNRITAMLGPLPVYAGDPVERLRIVSESMKGLKDSKQAVGAETLTRLQDFAPPTILAQASRLNFSTRAYNLLVTNVPGPQFPLYLLGREMLELAPVPFLAPKRALAIAIMSYNGNVVIGLMGDYDAMADLEAFAGYIQDSLSELLDAARARQPSKPKGTAATAKTAKQDGSAKAKAGQPEPG